MYEASTLFLETQQAIEDAESFLASNDNGSYGDHYDQGKQLSRQQSKESEAQLKYKASWFKQFRWLFWRTWTDNNRNPAINRARFVQTIIISLIVGVIYWNQGSNQKSIMNINGALFLLQLQITYGNLFMVLNSFPTEFPLFKREHYNAIYRVDTYYISHILAELPMFILVPFLTGAIVYFMIGLYSSAPAFFMFVAAFILMSLATVAFGHLLSTMTVDVTLAVALAPVFVNPAMFFGGLFLNTDTVPWYMKPIQWVSWFFYTNELLVVNQWEGVTKLRCEYARPVYEYINDTLVVVGKDVSMCFTDGLSVIDSFSFSLDSKVRDVLCLLALAIGFEIVAYIFLWWRSKQK